MDVFISCSVRVYLEDVSVINVFFLIVGHTVECRAHQNQGALRVASVVFLTCKVVDVFISCSVRVYLEDGSAVVASPEACHSVECGAHQNQGALRVASVVFLTCKVVDVFISCSVRVYLEDGSAVVASPEACHSVECGAHQNQGALRVAPVVFLTCEVVDVFISCSVRVYLEDGSAVIISPVTCHSVECGAHQNQGAPRVASVVFLTCEVVDVFISCSVRVYLEDDPTVAASPVACHSVECGAAYYERAVRTTPSIGSTEKNVYYFVTHPFYICLEYNSEIVFPTVACHSVDG